MADAIGRTLWRLLVSGRRRLEWVSAESGRAPESLARQVVRQMWAAAPRDRDCGAGGDDRSGAHAAALR